MVCANIVVRKINTRQGDKIIEKQDKSLTGLSISSQEQACIMRVMNETYIKFLQKEDWFIEV
jgi:hypothetical protein